MPTKYASHKIEKNLFTRPFLWTSEFLQSFLWTSYPSYAQIFTSMHIINTFALIIFFFFWKNQIICLNCLYLDGSIDLTILNHKFIIQIICLNYLYL